MKSTPDDKYLKKLRTICNTFPEFAEVEAWGHPTFRAGKKMFAAYGRQDDLATLGLNVGFDRQEALLKDPRFFPTPYAAHRGWVSTNIDKKTDWQEIAALLHEAYKRVANKRMLKQLEDKDHP